MALALHALLRSRFPQDAIQVVGFSNYARELRETDLVGLGWDMVQGTNLHHPLKSSAVYPLSTGACTGLGLITARRPAVPIASRKSPVP